MEVWLNRVVRQEGDILLEMTAFNEDEQEVFRQPIAEQTALLVEAVLAERPFKPAKPGLYYFEVLGVGSDRTMGVVIHKGRARVRRSIPITTDKAL